MNNNIDGFSKSKQQLTIENNRNSWFLFLAISSSHNQCCRLPTEPTRLFPMSLCNKLTLVTSTSTRGGGYLIFFWLVIWCATWASNPIPISKADHFCWKGYPFLRIFSKMCEFFTLNKILNFGWQRHLSTQNFEHFGKTDPCPYGWEA